MEQQAQVVAFTPMDVTQKAQAEIDMLNREVASMSENVTDLLRSQNDLQSRVDALERIVADVIGRNCLLVSPVVMAGENEPAEDKA